MIQAMRRLRLPSGAATACAALVVTIIVSQLLLVGDYQVDDAYISFAFGKNLAAGHGLTYGNRLRVEGYSNFMWTVISALVQLAAPQRIYLGMRVVAFSCLAVTLLFTFRLTARYAGKSWAWCPVLLLACLTDLTGAAQSALETVGYVAALLVTVYYYLTEARTRRRSSGWYLLLLTLIRIDGVVHVAFFLGWTGACWLLERRRPRTLQTLKWLGGPALVYAAYFSWRYAYYGLPLPTTYYAKSLIRVLMPHRGLDYVWSATEQLGLIFEGLFALLGVLLRRTRERIFLTLLIAYHLVYVSYIGGDWMPFHRFLLPVFPFLAVLCSWGALEAWRLTRRAPALVRATAGVAIAGSLGYIAILQDAYSIDTPQERDERDLRAGVAQHTHGLVQASRLFKWMTRAPSDTLVTDYGGVFAYYTDASIIEMWGLCNADIALRGNAQGINPVYGKTCVECYRQFRPDYFHANVPLIRAVHALRSQSQVIAAIFQAGSIGTVLDFSGDYVAGRVVDNKRGEAFYFLERKRDGLSFAPRCPAPGIRVEYPFTSREQP